MSARIAVLGGGLLGVCTALELARRGRRVTLIEGAREVLQGASRWNEGKIHLGFLYSADPTLRTATRLIPGGLLFGSQISSLLGRDLEDFTTSEDDIFLVHRKSVVEPAAFEAYANHTAALVREAARASGAGSYLADVKHAGVRKLSAAELSAFTPSEDIAAGYRIPERSVSTTAIADLLIRALANETRVEVHTDTWIRGVVRRTDGRLEVLTEGAAAADLGGGFDIVVNALWEGRPAVDATLGIRPPAPWSHRFRAAVFASGAGARLESAMVCTGPFGDVKQYADVRLYLSWYEAGLLAVGHDIEPPRSAAALTPERRSRILQDTLTALSAFFPGVANLDRANMHVNGGWVYAVGQGSLADRASTLHRRDQFDLTIDGGYISVDTAKYSLAPWLAAQVAQTIASK